MSRADVERALTVVETGRGRQKSQLGVYETTETARTDGYSEIGKQTAYNGRQTGVCR